MLIWVALSPLLLAAVAVALVPVVLGIIHDDRARNTTEHSHLFFVPARGAQPMAEQGLKSEVEERLERVEAVLGQAWHGRGGQQPNVVAPAPSLGSSQG